MIRTQKRTRLCTVLLIVNLSVIWGNSLLPGSESGAMSGGIMAFVMELLNIPESAGELLHLLIRKAAHFTEFACLGALLCWRFGMAGDSRYKSSAVLWAMAAALTDESIQMLIPDRGPSLKDVWIDTSGALAGMILVAAGYHLRKRIKRK